MNLAPLREKMMSFTFSREDRLLWRSQFLEVQDRGRKVHALHFVVFSLPNHLDRNRLGVSVSRRVGPAVIRNRVKRRVREFFRLNRSVFPASTDVVVVARRSAATAPTNELWNDLQRVGRRLAR